ncbi:LysR family transcriptional regulator [Thiofilum flexile]|uniref:LysR family transcriptional regulator n=1 Tax=Thiofilum flexile TaxID=125627 RepID=UPI000382E62F|nr:LysR family transcriptional regulator [Thiofilum flexile]
MHPRQVQSLLKVVELGSVNRAAEELYLAPSSISAQLKELSSTLGVELFETVGRGIVLSPSGRELLPLLQQLHNLVGDIYQQAQSITTKPVGVLKLFAPSSMCIYRMPSLIEQLQTLAPQLEIHLTHEPFDYQRALLQADIDAAIVVSESVSSEWQAQQWHKENVVYVCHPKRHQAQTLSLIQLLEQPIITTEVGCTYRVRAEQHFKAHDLTLKPRQAFANVEVIKRCLFANMGIGLLPFCVVAEDVAEGRLALQAVEGAPYAFASWLIYPKNRCLLPKLQVLLECVQRDHANDQ